MYRYPTPVLFLFYTMFSLGCSSSHYASLAYKSDISAGNCNGLKIKVDKVVDRRNDNSPLRYGTVRGGFGNPLKKLFTEKSIPEDIKAMFEQALVKRGCIIDEKSPWSIKPEVIVLFADYLVQRDANCRLSYTIISANQEVMYKNESVRQNKELSAGAGIFADVDHFKNFIDVTVSQCVDSAVDDSDLWRIIKR